MCLARFGSASPLSLNDLPLCFIPPCRTAVLTSTINRTLCAAKYISPRIRTLTSEETTIRERAWRKFRTPVAPCSGWANPKASQQPAMSASQPASAAPEPQHDPKRPLGSDIPGRKERQPVCVRCLDADPVLIFSRSPVKDKAVVAEKGADFSNRRMMSHGIVVVQAFWRRWGVTGAIIEDIGVTMCRCAPQDCKSCKRVVDFCGRSA